MTNPSYQYADGNGNVYIITPGTLEYVPLKPQESSSGVYSGGDPKTVALTQQEFQTIAALLEAARKNPDIQITERRKGSGMITTLTGTEKHAVILKSDSAELFKIEATLKEILS